MVDENEFKVNSQAVQAHLTITQAIIQRMATNSTSCKAWCITLVSAILVIVADKGKPQYTLIAIVPTILFLALDTYYLSLEVMFRHSYNSFIAKLHKDEVVPSDLYVVAPSGDILMTFISSLRSFSIWPFYGTLLIMIWLVKAVVIVSVVSR